MFSGIFNSIGAKLTEIPGIITENPIGRILESLPGTSSPLPTILTTPPIVPIIRTPYPESSQEPIRPDVTNDLFGKLPDPTPIHQIAPALKVWTRERNTYFSYRKGPNYFMETMRECNLIRERIVFVTHGYQSTINADWVTDIMKDMLCERDQTVVLVDWATGADCLWYRNAAANAIAVGEWLGEYFAEIKRQFGADHVVWGVGHSLGAHLMGTAGRRARSRGYSIDRITGLDPAGPEFQIENLDKRLRRTDADFVDVIHTDGLGTPYFGTLDPLGDVDYYPNFGYRQLQNSLIGKVTDNAYDMVKVHDSLEREYGSRAGSSVRVGPTVDHSRAYELFSWSIRNRGKFVTSKVFLIDPSMENPSHVYTSKHCHTEMGYWASKNDRCSECSGYRSYYIRTNVKEPWID